MRSSFRNSKPNSVILVATDSRGCKLFEGRRRNWWQLLWPEDDRSFCKITQQTKNLKNSGAVVRLCLSLCLPLLHTHSNGRRPTRGRVKAKKMKEWKYRKHYKHKTYCGIVKLKTYCGIVKLLPIMLCKRARPFHYIKVWGERPQHFFAGYI